MLSILIPTYKYNVNVLVKSLHLQAIELNIDFEIIVMEDGATDITPLNHALSTLPNCTYIVLPQNIGRAAIRNKLADTAKYDTLLFLDCDSEIPSPIFLKNYINHCGNKNIVLGGRIYQNNEPNYSLVTKYGKMRERNDVQNQQARQKFPMFTTPNFLIPKSIFNNVRFDETIVGYGHEDTIFGIKLHQLQYSFLFIDNPVYHIGIEDNLTYITKTEKGIENLFNLHLSGKYPLLQKESKLLGYFLKINRKHLCIPISICYHMSKKWIINNLCSANPSLLLFDIYKLMYLCNFSTKK